MGSDDQRTELSREQLYAQVWAEPMTKVAQRYALSDRGLAKICQRMGVPVPGRGYWAKVQSGHVPPQPKLPEIKAGQDAKVVLDRRGSVLEEKETFQKVAGLIESEIHPEKQIVVADELIDPHPLVVKTAKSLRGARLNDYGIAIPRLKGCLDIRVGKASIERAARIMDALIKALDARAIELVPDAKDDGVTRLLVDGEALEFRLEGKVTREQDRPTGAEQRKLDKDPFYRYRLPKDSYSPSGELSLKLGTGWGSGLRGTWADGKKQRVEDCLNKFVVAL